LLAHSWWFSPGTPASSTGHHAIAEILLKVALNTINQIKPIVAAYFGLVLHQTKKIIAFT
jgi:hypothetical protein